MMSEGLHVLYFLNPRVILSLHSKSLPRCYKIKTTVTYVSSVVTMMENIKMKNLVVFVKVVILHNFSSPRTPQQNEVVERKNSLLKNLL